MHQEDLTASRCMHQGVAHDSLVKQCQPEHAADAHLGAGADACAPGDGCTHQPRNSHTRLDAVLVEAIAGPGTRKVHAACALDVWQAGLRLIGGRAGGWKGQPGSGGVVKDGLCDRC